MFRVENRIGEQHAVHFDVLERRVRQVSSGEVCAFQIRLFSARRSLQFELIPANEVQFSPSRQWEPIA